MVGAPGEGLRGAERRGGAGRLGGPGGGVGRGGRDPGAGRRGLGPAWEKSPVETWACDPRLGFARCPERSKRSGPARSRAPRSSQSPRSLASSSAASDPARLWPPWPPPRACGPWGRRGRAGSGAARGLRSPPASAAGDRPGSGGRSRGRDPPARGSGTASGQRPAGVRGCSQGGWPAGPGKREGRRRPGRRPRHPTRSTARLGQWSAPPATEPSLSITADRSGGEVRRGGNPRMLRLQTSLAWAQWPSRPCRTHTEDLSGATWEASSTAFKPRPSRQCSWAQRGQPCGRRHRCCTFEKALP